MLATRTVSDQPTLDLLLDQVALLKPIPTIVQVGAFDGSTGDPLCAFLERHRAQAMLLEPQPVPFATLKAKYSGYTNVVTVNAAVSAHNGTSRLYIVEGTHAEDPWWCDQIASFHKEHLLRHSEGIPNLADRIRAIEVPTVSPETLMQRYGLPHLDALIVDAEGADWQIVQLFLDRGFVPDILFFEWRHLDQQDLAAARSTLTELGYEVEFQSADVVAYRNLSVA